jgi:hypothetical protein
MKFVFFYCAAKSVSLASIVHGTIHRSNTGPAKPTFVNFQALQSVTTSMKVAKWTFEAVNFASRFLSVEHPWKYTVFDWVTAIFVVRRKPLWWRPTNDALAYIFGAS